MIAYSDPYIRITLHNGEPVFQVPDQPTIPLEGWPPVQQRYERRWRHLPREAKVAALALLPEWGESWDDLLDMALDLTTEGEWRPF